ncbi:MAG: hypothetical protein NT069_26905, partial [Planctomycetota bacterium]|nr:hypothetical protein [Planctomycetota bacterium]
DVLRSVWSTTWRARVVASGRSVAITFLSPRRRLAEEVIERLRNVATFRPRGVDGGLIAVIGSGIANGLQFLVLDNVAGTPLTERLTAVGSDPVQAARIAASVARDVAAIQSAELTVDRVDAEQILIDNGGRVFLTDYWCNLLGSSDLAGNAKGSRSAEPAIRAMGDLLATLLSLPAQYRSPSVVGVNDGENQDDVPPDSSCQPLATICRQCVRPAPGRAYHSVGEVAADLERYLRNEPILAAPPTWRERCGWWLVEEPTLGPRVVTVILAITIVQSRHLLAHQPWSHHAEIKLILLLWGILSFGFRWLAVRRTTRALGRTVWALTDVVFASTCLALTEPEMGSLLIVYPLLQALTSLWRSGPLMTLTTFASLAGYLTLLWFRNEPQPQPHYHVLAMAAIALTGLFLKPSRSRHGSGG